MKKVMSENPTESFLRRYGHDFFDELEDILLKVNKDSMSPNDTITFDFLFRQEIEMYFINSGIVMEMNSNNQEIAGEKYIQLNISTDNEHITLIYRVEKELNTNYFWKSWNTLVSYRIENKHSFV